MFQKYRVVEELEKADGNRISFTFTLADAIFSMKSPSTGSLATEGASLLGSNSVAKEHAFLS